MTDPNQKPDPEATASSETPERRTTRMPRSPRRGRIMVPWWGLTLAGGAAGYMMAGGPGAILGGVLGFFAWKLR